ncbi:MULTISPECIES: L,D-transpeptidase [Bacillaceae]|uniref:L,D-transpeptidase n=1 Tax=Bacillaceae TaxID=186817 RepID=UPI001C56D64D|nr:L,D-transpeptidase [Rossellomorea sp. YZS02]MBW3113446.1 L,D-transpeptidase [Bacillus sp. MCCB 382]MDX8344860.1 L,D-transpeptidase [Rossellomorea sp. YZS02]
MRLLLAIILFASPIWPLGRNPIPGDPFVIVNKENNQLAFISDGEIQGTFPVATGKNTELTPEGLFNVTVKAKNPYYRKKNIPGGDPRNPLGSRWIGFDAEGTDGRIYGIHGTNQPSSIGKYISNGCIRMHNNNVEYLFDKVPIGTRVLVVKTKRSFEQLGKEYGALR